MTIIRHILLLCFIAYAHGNALHLTKEYDIAQEIVQRNPVQNLISDTASLLQNPQTFEYFLRYPENFVNNLASLLNRNPNPQPEDIIDFLNSDIGSRLFVVQDDVVRLDSDALNKLLSQGALNIAKQLYPDDFYKQWTAFATYQGSINLVTAQMKPIFQSASIPLRSLTIEQLTAAGRKIMKRDVANAIQTRDAVTDLVNGMVSSVCSVVTDAVINIVNPLLVWVKNLLKVEVASEEAIGALINLLLTAVSDLGTTIIDSLNQTIITSAGNICNQLFSTSTTTTTTTTTTSTSTSTSARKRRDLENVQLLQREVDLLGGLYSAIISLVRQVLLYVCDLVIAFCSTEVNSLVDGLMVWMTEQIDQIFPA